MLQDQDLIAIQEVRTKVEKAHAAWLKFREFSQEQVDAIIERIAAAGRAHAVQLAEMAVEETSYGNVKDKVAKNLIGADFLPRFIRNMKTVGVLREIPEQKIVEYGVSMGVVAAIVPTTNPTSTVIYKVIIALKAGNAIVISPHPHAKNCTCYTADLLYRAALEAGAPEDIIQCLGSPTLESTQLLMKHPKVAVILATGGSGLVRAAYSSGKPAFGVGPGNVPVLIESSADIADAVAKVVEGKSFDYGTVCSSEQTLVATQDLKEQILSNLRAQKAYLCTPQQRDAIAKVLITPAGGVNARCVGQSPQKIAQLAGFEVPADTSVIVAEIEGIGKFHPLSAEKLSPVLSLYFVPDFKAAVDACVAILNFGGLGHTCGIYSRDENRIREFAAKVPAFRVLVNTPAPQGSIGITTGIQPSMTLGCGAVAGNSTSDNVGPQHLINIKRLAYVVRKAEEALNLPNITAAAQETPRREPAAVPVAAVPERQAVISAVEKYLAQRGLQLGSAGPVATPPVPAPKPVPVAPPPVAAPPRVASAVVGNVTAQVVDQFLSAKRNSVTAVCSAAKTAGTGVACAGRKPTEAPAQPPAAPAPTAPAAAPAPAIVDFVCENDVRVAMNSAQKIHIGPKTIVTPAARELAASKDVLVVVSRP